MLINPKLIPGAKTSPKVILTALAAERMRRAFTLFGRRAWHIVEPKSCVWNWHMDAIAEHLVYVTQGEIRFLMIEVPPRMTKSLLASVLWPAWHWIVRPQTQFISASYSRDLALDFSKLSRRLMVSGWFQQFYGTEWYLLPYENKADFYTNSAGGYRITTGVDGVATGRGGDIQLLDDSMKAKDANSDTIANSTIAWHDGSWRSRVNSPNHSQKVYIAQRLRDNDVMGHVFQQEGHRWVKLSLPMEFDAHRRCITYLNDGRGVKPSAKPIFCDPREEDGELLNPKRFDKDTADAEKKSMSDRDWNAQYQQQPEGQGGLILKRKWWRPWTFPEGDLQAGQVMPLPESYIEVIQVWDTALEEDEEADYSAMTTWGIFSHVDKRKDLRTGRVLDGRQRICAILLDMLEQRLEYPDLRAAIINRQKDWDSDYVLIEKKASGHGLIQECRRKGLPIKAVKLEDGGDKVARAKTASLMLEKGCIYYVPTHKPSLHVIDRAAKFPGGPKDLVDTLSIAWQYMRRHSDLSLPDDEDAGEITPFRWQKRKYG